MLNSLRAEHYVALAVAGLFLLFDIAVIWIFSNSLPVEPTVILSRREQTVMVAENDMTANAPPPKPILRARTTNILGGSVESKSAAVESLENAILQQIQQQTPTK